MGIFGEHILSFNTEPTVEEVEDTVALLINKGIMKLKSEKGFHRKYHWTLTY